MGMDGPLDVPIPNGMVWNMTYDPAAPPGHLPEITHGPIVGASCGLSQRMPSHC